MSYLRCHARSFCQRFSHFCTYFVSRLHPPAPLSSSIPAPLLEPVGGRLVLNLVWNEATVTQPTDLYTQDYPLVYVDTHITRKYKVHNVLTNLSSFSLALHINTYI